MARHLLGSSACSNKGNFILKYSLSPIYQTSEINSNSSKIYVTDSESGGPPGTEMLGGAVGQRDLVVTALGREWQPSCMKDRQGFCSDLEERKSTLKQEVLEAVTEPWV